MENESVYTHIFWYSNKRFIKVVLLRQCLWDLRFWMAVWNLNLQNVLPAATLELS